MTISLFIRKQTPARVAKKSLMNSRDTWDKGIKQCKLKTKRTLMLHIRIIIKSQPTHQFKIQASKVKYWKLFLEISNTFVQNFTKCNPKWMRIPISKKPFKVR
jgi:hypothetical protein